MPFARVSGTRNIEARGIMRQQSEIGPRDDFFHTLPQIGLQEIRDGGQQVRQCA